MTAVRHLLALFAKVQVYSSGVSVYKLVYNIDVSLYK